MVHIRTDARIGPAAAHTNTHLRIHHEHTTQVVTVLPVWVGHYSPRTYTATAEVVVADPPSGNARPLANTEAVFHRLVIMERGEVPLVDKVAVAQEAGALGVIVTDMGDCTAFDQHCSPGADKSRGEGFGRLDMARPWGRIKIPIVMMLRDDADILLSQFGR